MRGGGVERHPCQNLTQPLSWFDQGCWEQSANCTSRRAPTCEGENFGWQRRRVPCAWLKSQLPALIFSQSCESHLSTFLTPFSTTPSPPYLPLVPVQVFPMIPSRECSGSLAAGLGSRPGCCLPTGTGCGTASPTCRRTLVSRPTETIIRVRVRIQEVMEGSSREAGRLGGSR